MHNVYLQQPWANDSDLAHYGFLMQSEIYQLPLNVEYILVRMTLVGIGLSVVGSLLSVFLICYVPIRSDGLFAVGNMCVALLGAQLAFAGAENAFPQKMMCKISTASIHYLFLSVHCWAFAFFLHLLLKLTRVLHGKRAKRRFILVTIGWVLPMVIVATTAVLVGDKYGDGKLCWLSPENGSHWAFVGPVCFTCAMNMLILVLVILVQFKHDLKKDVSLSNRLKNTMSTLLIQLPVSNVSWLLGLVPANYITAQYLFVMFNASQGMFIFACHMMCSTQIRGLLKSRLGTGMGVDGHKHGNVSQSDSTANTQSVEMDIVGEGLKTVTSSKKRDS